jgi:hypothetical protein
MPEKRRGFSALEIQSAYSHGIIAGSSIFITVVKHGVTVSFEIAAERPR